MTILLYLLLALLLLLLNAFFVLAEFAAVKLRPSRVEQLVDQGNVKAKLVQHIQSRLDDYLAVCQLGITFASVALGIVGEKAVARVILGSLGVSSGAAHAIASTAVLILISALHVVLGEQVPKMFAIRRPEGSALLIALPLQFFRWLFYLPLTLLSGTTTAILKLFGITGRSREAEHSEEELRIILAQSQTTGLMSFRRLLFLENIFDLGGLKVRDVMRLRTGVKVLKAAAPWDENFKVIKESRFSRFPLVDGQDMPVGVIHVKDLLYEGTEKLPAADLRKLARPYTTASEEMPLESLLAELQRSRGHLAMVRNAEGKWTGFISLEDVLEEIIGTIEDEFEVEPPMFLADALTPGRVILGLHAASLEEVIGKAFGSVPASEVPLPVERASKAVLDRERAMSTYLGNGLAVPHARLEGMDKPVLLFSRSHEGVPVAGRDERAHLIFILLTPAGAPRIQVRLLARICGLVDSEYVAERLRTAETPAGVVEAIRAAEISVS